MRGILSAAGYVPYWRLPREAITRFLGGGPVRGSRAVASFDEDTTTMAVEASRLALRSAPAGVLPGAVWFSTTEPAYGERTNATTIHAALRLDGDVGAYDMGSGLRSAVGAVRTALDGAGTVLVTAAGIRTGLPGSADEAAGGDGASALVVGSDDDGDLLAVHLASASATEEFVERWRLPGEPVVHHWEERFAENVYRRLADRAWSDALKRAGLEPGDVDVAVVTGPHARSVKLVGARLGARRVADDLTAGVGNTGSAHPGLVLASVLEALEPDQPEQVVALLSLADGADVLLFNTTAAAASYRPARSVARQIAEGAEVPYAKFLSWRGMMRPQPPNRPEPNRPSSSAAARSHDWKYGFVGSVERTSGAVHLPPTRVGFAGDVDAMDPAPMADVPATIRAITVDRLAFSPDPPIVFAVLDFDGGGRFACELTDVEAGQPRVGDRTLMTFRRLYTADGIHNYFWKARPLRGKET